METFVSEVAVVCSLLDCRALNADMVTPMQLRETTAQPQNLDNLPLSGSLPVADGRTLPGIGTVSMRRFQLDYILPTCRFAPRASVSSQL